MRYAIGKTWYERLHSSSDCLWGRILTLSTRLRVHFLASITSQNTTEEQKNERNISYSLLAPQEDLTQTLVAQHLADDHARVQCDLLVLVPLEGGEDDLRLGCDVIYGRPSAKGEGRV
jgi:hypothetical protein